MTPAKLAEVTGLSADMQRDWRRRGYITLGTMQPNGRWLYDWYDAFCIYLIRKLYDAGCELPRANLFSASIHKQVLMNACHIRAPEAFGPQRRFIRMQIDPRGRAEDGHWLGITFDSLNGIEAKGFAFVVDCEQLAREIPESLDPVIEHLIAVARGEDVEG
ncbi:hypothetical protein [Paracoccus sp. SCSIO 75233]|uniref:hypothetical protein n=1 Tax=Paracoccus sp. SCSIO 75233 TaxID=3017782 RepID=UPI0022F0AE95|nr:hypothetical protein [Paracoccus sp. SCSIO 75233]WBU53326.1 hypothetical protein PAF12_00345 [Paracoccus sp. SCSIO 75233]